MVVISVKELLEAGFHFGHQTKRWNPKMKKFIFGERKGTHIVDLEKSVEAFEEAYRFLSEVASKNESVLFVGTKRQAQGFVVAEAGRCGMFYVNQRWLGGTLTNFRTIRKRAERLRELVSMEESGKLDLLSKKEATRLRRERGKLEKSIGGIAKMNRLPGALVVVDPHRERIAVLETRKLNIPVVAMIDTNCDPDEVDYCVPGNDDAIRSIELFISKMADAVCEGSKKAGEKKEKEKEKEKEKGKEKQVKEEKGEAVPKSKKVTKAKEKSELKEAAKPEESPLEPEEQPSVESESVGEDKSKVKSKKAKDDLSSKKEEV